jgi:SAM-dependent methyltransferase
MSKEVVVSEVDKLHLKIIRESVSSFIKTCSDRYDKEGIFVLDIAPQVHEGARAYFNFSTIQTLDIDPNSNADFIADLCVNNTDLIPSNHFDVIICTEVLEHTLNPFSAVKEIYRMLKNGGAACISVPFNFRIHGPLPDCWRFTEHGLKALFSEFKEFEIKQVDTPDRDLMPIHYTLIAIK